ncbi:MAG: diheme cytochrome c [Magnetococcus sp. WYHC-3]
MRHKQILLGGTLMALLVAGSLALGLESVNGAESPPATPGHARQTSGLADDVDDDDDADDEYDPRGPTGRERSRRQQQRDVAPVSDPLYQQECGACHFAYQSGWLPARSWESLLTTLKDHFGENAAVDEATRLHLLGYLTAHAADREGGRHARAILKDLPRDAAPSRISETRYFQKQHHEVPLRMVRDNPGVTSWSRCDACHTDADQGRFAENQVRIPGFGNWDD